MHTALFPGTFDPVTSGHADILRRSALLFDRVIAGVAENPRKHTMFSLAERVDMMQEVCAELKLENVEILGFSNMLPDFLRQCGATVLVRGVRTAADSEYELQLTGMYRTVLPKLETVLLPTDGSLSFISSTLIRDIIEHKGDLRPFTPACVASRIMGAY